MNGDHHKNAVFVTRFDHKSFEIVLLLRLTRNFAVTLHSIKMEMVELENQWLCLIHTNRNKKNHLQHFDAIQEYG